MQSFFYWGEMPLADEVADDILAGLCQSKRTMYYNREYGAGIGDYENAPVSLSTVVMIKYDATRFMATRNGAVTDGNGGPDRRAATSQSIITVEPDGAGLNVVVPYIMLADMTRPKSLTLQFGGTK